MVSELGYMLNVEQVVTFGLSRTFFKSWMQTLNKDGEDAIHAVDQLTSEQTNRSMN